MSVGDFLHALQMPGDEVRVRVEKSPTLNNHRWTPLDLKRHTHDIRYQAPPLFSRVLQKIGEPGDEVTIHAHHTHVTHIVGTCCLIIYTVINSIQEVIWICWEESVTA